jgi:hypothetical protein
VRIALTFVIVLAGWAIFRSQTLTELGRIYGGMFGLHGLGPLPWPPLHAKIAYLFLPIACGVAFLLPNSWRIVKAFQPLVVLGILASFLVALAQFFTREYSPFIYFQF